MSEQNENNSAPLLMDRIGWICPSERRCASPQPGDNNADLILIVDDQEFRVHRDLMSKGSELIKSWLETPLIQAGDPIRLDPPLVQVPTALNHKNRHSSAAFMFNEYLQMVYKIARRRRYLFDERMARFVASNVSIFSNARLAVLANFMISPQLLDICDLALVRRSIFGFDRETVAFARLYNLKRFHARAFSAIAAA